MGRAMLNVCDAKKTKGIYKIGYLFAFLGSGTECRCCLGTRVALAFLLGLSMGLVATYNAILSAAIIVTFAFTVTLFFMLWYLWYKEQQDAVEDGSEVEAVILDSDTDYTDYTDYIVHGIETIYGRRLDAAEQEIIFDQFHKFKYQGVSGFQRNRADGTPVMAQWIKILESGR